MSESNWGGRIAVIGCAVAVLFILWGLSVSIYSQGWASGLHQAEANGYAAEYPSDTDERLKKCLADGFSSDAKKCVEEAIASSREAQRSEQDLKAQRDMSEWAWWLLIVSLAQIPIGVGGLLALVVTIRQGREGLKIAQNTVVLENRAWLKLEVAHGGIRKVGGDDLNASVKLTMQNVGRTPAIIVAINIGTHIMETADPKPSPKDIAFQANQQITLYPNDNLEHGLTFYVQKENVVKVVNKGIVPALCIDV